MKEMLKRLTALMLCLLCLVPLAACGGSDSDGSSLVSEEGGDSASSAAEEEVPLGKLHTGYEVDEGAPVATGDVVVIQLNSVAKFALDSGVMPALSEFAAKGAYYSSFYAQRGGEEGVYSAMTSLYAPIDGISKDASYYSLAKLFADGGYKVNGTLAEGNAYLSALFGLEASVEKPLENALTLAGDSDKNFTFVELDAVKYPYMPEKTEGVAISGNRSLNSYLCCAAYADSLLASFFTELEKLGDKAPTVLIYGTAPKLDGKFTDYSKEYPELFTDGFRYDNAFRAPMVLWGPQVEAGKSAALATIYDIYPTLAAHFGLSSDKMLVCGENVYKNSSIPVVEEKVTVAANIAKGKSYTVTAGDGSKVKYMFAVMSDDGVKLADGITDDGTGNPQTGFAIVLGNCSKTHYITVDLGKEMSFDRLVMQGIAADMVSFGALKGDSFAVEVSKDGETFNTVSSTSTTATNDENPYTSYTQSLDEAATARYVRFSFAGTGTYLSVSEVEVYECLPESESKDEEEEAVSLKDFRFFALQGDYIRGNFITDTVYYTKGEGVATVFAKQGGELSVRNYKNHYKYVLETINECEYAVKYGYYEGGKTYAGLVDSLPDKSGMTLIAVNATEGGGSMSGHGDYLGASATFYTPGALAGIWDGLVCNGSKITVVENGAKGSIITGEFDHGTFDRLYVVPNIKHFTGNASLYVSYVMDNGVNSAWLRLDTYFGTTGYMDGKSCIIPEDEGEITGRFRLKIELECGEDGTSPELYGVTVSPVRFDEGDTATAPEGEVELDFTVSGEKTGDSGIIAVESLVASALSVAPDYTKAGDFITSFVSSKNPDTSNITSLARYACERGVYAYVDCYGADELINALNSKQPVVIASGTKYLVAIGYGADGVTVLDVTTDEKTVIPYTDIRQDTEVLIVNSALYTPEIIDNFIAENSAVRPGIVVDKKKYIVIHNTGNYSAGSNAAAHDKYIQGLENSPDRSVSWHYTVDDVEIYHHLPDNESAWHASDGTYGEGNQFGIGIEICVNGFPGQYEGEEYEKWLTQFTKAVKNAAYLVSKLMVENELGMDDIKQHWDFAPDKKNCPMQMRYTSGSGTFTRDDGDMWVYFIKEVERQYARRMEEAAN